MRINIIGDIAGRYEEFLLLLKKMPEADLVLSVGDMIDRGPDSKKVIEYFMNTPNTEAIYGNHEDMFVNYMDNAGDFNHMYMWTNNGGKETLKSYEDPEDPNQVLIPKEHIDWLKARPMFFELNDLFVSHAPCTSLFHAPTDPYSRDDKFIWNRWVPTKQLSKFMVYGHNGTWVEHKWGDSEVFAVCVDNSHHGEITGMHWPTKEKFSQVYLDAEDEKY